MTSARLTIDVFAWLHKLCLTITPLSEGTLQYSWVTHLGVHLTTSRRRRFFLAKPDLV